MDDLQALRQMVIDRIAANQHTYTYVAEQLGVSGPFLHQFRNGEYKSISVQFAIRLARYMGKSVPEVLRMAGYDDIAALLQEVHAAKDDVYTQELAEVIDDLAPAEKVAIIQNARNMARVFKESKPKYIGGKGGKAKK